MKRIIIIVIIAVAAVVGGAACDENNAREGVYNTAEMPSMETIAPEFKILSGGGGILANTFNEVFAGGSTK